MATTSGLLDFADNELELVNAGDDDDDNDGDGDGDGGRVSTAGARSGGRGASGGGGRKRGADHDEDDEDDEDEGEDEDEADYEEAHKAKQRRTGEAGEIRHDNSGSAEAMARQREEEEENEEEERWRTALLAQFDDDQRDRYENFRRSKLKAAAVRKIVHNVTGKEVSKRVATVMAGITKTFVGELVEKALDVQNAWRETGPLRPRHMREAYRQLQKFGADTTTRAQPRFPL